MDRNRLSRKSRTLLHRESFSPAGFRGGDGADRRMTGRSQINIGRSHLSGIRPPHPPSAPLDVRAWQTAQADRGKCGLNHRAYDAPPRSGVIYVAHGVSRGKSFAQSQAAERRHFESRSTPTFRCRRSAAGNGSDHVPTAHAVGYVDSAAPRLVATARIRTSVVPLDHVARRNVAQTLLSVLR